MPFSYDNLEKLQRMNETLKNGFYTEHIPFEESAAGKQFAELQKLRQDFDNYVAQQEAQRKADEERQRAERKRNTFVSLAAGSFTGIASGIFLYYWPNIVAWISSLVH